MGRTLETRVHKTNLTLNIVWVKAHGIEEPLNIDTYNIKPIDLFGNACADLLADRAAESASLSMNVVAKVLDALALLQLVQSRLLAVLADIISLSPARSVAKPPCPAPLPLSFFALRSEHALVVEVGSASCAKCLRGTKGKPSFLKAWMGSPCFWPYHSCPWGGHLC